MRAFLIVAAAAFTLAACSKEDAQNSAAYGEAREPVRPDKVAPPSSPAAAPASAEIPAAFRGVWDYVKGTCNGASDLRLEIGQRGVAFYEAYGEVTKLTVESPDSVIVDLAMEGEGETWMMRTRYTLSEGGQILTPTALEDRGGEPMPLKRCPAETAQ